MALINFTEATNGNTANASDINTPLNTIYDEFNGNISSVNLASNAVTTAKLADSSVTSPKLEMQAWQSWSPTTNFTEGNGTTTAKYIQIGKTIFFRYKFVLGSTSSLNSSTTTLSLPQTANSEYDNSINEDLDCLVSVRDSSASIVNSGRVTLDTDNDTIRLRVLYGTGNYEIFDGAGDTNVDATTPFTFATGDSISVKGTYEAA